VQAAAARAGIPVSVCGEMASDPVAAVLLLGLGYHRLSIAPPALPLVKWVVRHVPAHEAATAAQAVLAARDSATVRATLREVLGRHLDLRLVDPAGALPGLSVGASLPGFR
jgi:signal transduction protein with GAF and PtsI domain